MTLAIFFINYDSKRHTIRKPTHSTKHPKRAVGGLIFRSGFRDVHQVALQPCDLLAQSTDRTNHSQSEKERSKNQAIRCALGMLGVLGLKKCLRSVGPEAEQTLLGLTRKPRPCGARRPFS